MKIIIHFIILNIFYTIHAEFNTNLNYNQEENSSNYFNLNNNEESANSKNRGTVYYRSHQPPFIQNRLKISNNAIDRSEGKSGTTNYQIIQLQEDHNPYGLSKDEQNQNVDTKTKHINQPSQLYNTNEEKSPNRIYPENFIYSPHYSHQELPESKIVNYYNPLNDNRFNTDEANINIPQSSESYNNAETTNINDFNNEENDASSSVERGFQYQYNEGWSVNEALSIYDIEIPHLEDRKYSKYSTPNAPDAHYYQKFYNIYNYVEHQTKQDLGQYEMESINDDFNGRSIVAPGQYPHMAAIGFLSNEDKIEYKCGGSLISKLFVITAAHCCHLNGETPIIVKLGIINLKFQILSNEPQRRTIKEIIVHPSYNATMHYNDIALLKLGKSVQFTKFVRPILLWSSDDVPYERVFTMGYGSTSFAKAPTNILTELSLSLVPLEQCKAILPRNEKVPDGVLDSQICGRDLERNRDTCQGDSGGPLQLNLAHRKHRNTYRYYLVGIISYGEFCGSKNPGIYTRVSSYCRWIASVVWPSFDM